jgi:hypothetical protein
MTEPTWHFELSLADGYRDLGEPGPECPCELCQLPRRCPDCWSLVEKHQHLCTRCGQDRASSSARASAARRRSAVANHPGISAVHERALRAEPCYIPECGKPSEELDHIIPLSRGGIDEEQNLAPLCRTHNRSKSTRLLVEWLGHEAGITAEKSARDTIERATEAVACVF